MNYTQFFAKGGRIDVKTIKSEIGRIFKIEDSKEIDALWQNAVQEYGSEEGVLNALFNAIGEDTSDESVQNAMMNVLNYTPMESQMFKCGGKLQKLLAKGGNVDCGCGGIKLQPGGQVPKVLKGTTPVLSAALAGLKTVRVPDVGPAKNRRVGAVRDNEGGLHLYEDAVVNGNSAQTAITIHPGDTVINQNVLRRSGWDPRKYVYGDDQYEAVMQRMRPFVNGVPYKQDGGELTRRQARQLATQNKGFNGEQFDLAMINVKDALRANSDLRGRALRQRAREIVSGITDQPAPRQMDILPTVEPISNTPLVGTMYKDGLVGQRPTGSADQLSFADRFKLARGRGEQTFDWRGKSYGTSLAKTSVSNEETSGVRDPFIKNYTPAPQRTVLPTTREPIRIETENGAYGYDDNGNWFESTYNNKKPTMLEEARIVAPSIPNRWPYNNQYSVLPRESGWSMNAPIVQWNPEQLTGNEREIAEEYYGYQRPRATKQSTPVSPVLRKCGGKVKEGQWGMSIIHPKVVYDQYQKIENALTPARQWEEKHGTKVVGGLGLPALVAPFSISPGLYELPAEKASVELIKAASQKQKAIEAATKAGKFYTEPKPSPSIINNFDEAKLIKYLKNTKFVK